MAKRKVARVLEYTDPNDLWKLDMVQFPRLIAEIAACGGFKPALIRDLCISMDLVPEEIKELVDRAEVEWNHCKREFCEPRWLEKLLKKEKAGGKKRR